MPVASALAALVQTSARGTLLLHCRDEKMQKAQGGIGLTTSRQGTGRHPTCLAGRIDSWDGHSASCVEQQDPPEKQLSLKDEGEVYELILSSVHTTLPSERPGFLTPQPLSCRLSSRLTTCKRSQCDLSGGRTELQLPMLMGKGSGGTDLGGVRGR